MKKKFLDNDKIIEIVEKHVPEKEVLETAILGTLTIGYYPTRISYGIGITNKSVIIFPYRNGIRLFNDEDKTFEVIKFSKELVCSFEIKKCASKFVIKLAKDKLSFGISRRYWKYIENNAINRQFEGNIQSLKLDNLTNDLFFLEDVFEASNSVNYYLENIEGRNDQLNDLWEKVTNKGEALRVAAGYFIFSGLMVLTLNLLVLFIFGINQIDYLTLLFYLGMGTLLWKSPPYAKSIGIATGVLIAFVTITEIVNIQGIVDYADLIIDILFCTALLATIMGNPSRKNILHGKVIFWVGHIGGAIIFSLYFFLK